MGRGALVVALSAVAVVGASGALHAKDGLGDLRRRIAETPADPAPFARLIDLLHAEGRWKELAELPAAFEGGDEDSLRILVTAASRLYVGERPEIGRPLVERALARDPGPPLDAGLRAMIAAADRQYDRAFELVLEYAKGCTGAPEELAVLRAVGDVLVRLPPDAFSAEWAHSSDPVAAGLLDAMPVIRKKVQPKPPRRGGRGQVAIATVATCDGHAVPLRVLKSNSPAVAEAAVTAIRQWIYEPGRKDGRPAATLFTVSVSMGP